MQDLTAPIVSVTVLEDRAFIRRHARLDLPQGRSRWRLAAISPVLVDKSLAVELEGNAQAVHVQVLRKRPQPQALVAPLAKASPPDPTESELLQKELRSAEQLYQELLLMIAEQSAWGKSAADVWEAQLVELVEWKEVLLERLLALTPVPAAPPPVPAVVVAPADRKTADVILELQAEETGTFALTLDYCVPLAAWRPYHQAEWGGQKVHFRAEGCVWQNTGEDWNEVQLILSTERHSLGSVPPSLVRDFIHTRKRNGEVVVQEREVAVQSLSVALAPDIPGIDDGGQTFSAPVSHPCSVPSDGQPVRVPLFEFALPAQMENLLAAEICPQVVQQTQLHNPTQWPILAGPVDILRQAGWVGRSRLGMVAPGESFRLGWGPEVSLRVSRTTTQSEEEKGDLLGGWMRTRHACEVTLSNLSSETRRVQVVERIPISEIKQVEVALDTKNIVPAASADEHGFLRWEVEVGPRSKARLESAYWLRRRKEVVGA